MLAIITTFLTSKLGGWVAGAAALAAVAFALWLTIHNLSTDVAKLKAANAADTAKATVSAAQTSVTQAAAATLSTGAQRDASTFALQEAHANAISAAQGATAPVDPALNAAGRSGLCRYAAYAGDPQCAGLLGADPKQP